MLGHGGQRRVRVEPLDQHDRAADAQRQPEHGVQPEHVEQRQHRERHLVGPVGTVGVGEDLVEVRAQVAVGEHGRPRRSGRPAREEQHGHVVGGAVDERGGVGSEEVGHVDDALVVGELAAVDGLGHLAARGTDQRQLRARGGQLALDLGRGALRVQRDGDGPGAEHGQVRRDEIPVVGGQDRHPVTRRDPSGGEGAAHARHLLAQLAVVGHPSPADQRGAVGVVSLDDGGQVHAGDSLAGGRLWSCCSRSNAHAWV